MFVVGRLEWYLRLHQSPPSHYVRTGDVCWLIRLIEGMRALSSDAEHGCVACLVQLQRSSKGERMLFDDSGKYVSGVGTKLLNSLQLLLALLQYSTENSVVVKDYVR